MKKIISLISFIIFLALAWNTTFAYQGPLPEIYISDVKTDKTVYNPGDTVKGTFLIKNYDNVIAPNIYYEIRLMGDYQDSIAQTAYSHSDMIGPLTLDKKENRTVRFEYKLPETLAGKGFGVQIQTMLQTGAGMGWGDALFEISGTSTFTDVKNINLTTSASSTAEYFAQQGPMVYKNDKAYLNFEFDNKNNAAQDVYPKLTIYDRSEAREVLLVRDETLISIKADEVSKNKIELPTFDYVPRVYVGKLDFVNKVGQQVSNSIDFRYIVFGQMATINNVIADKEYALEGETVNITVDITGAPFDINDPAVSASSTGSVLITLTNESDKVVGEKTVSDIDFNDYDITTYPIETTEQAKTLNANVKAFGQDGTLLGEMSVNLTKNPMPEENNFLSLVFVLIILLLIILIVWFAIRKNNKIVVTLSLITLLLVGGWWIVNTTSKTQAFVIVEEYHHRYRYTFYLNYPTPYTEFPYSPGQTIDIQASATISGCSNVTNNSRFTVLNDDSGQGALLGSVPAEYINGTVTVTSSSRSAQFAIPGFKIQPNVGTNKLWTLFVWDYGGLKGNSLLGYESYLITPPIISVDTLISCGEKVKLVWEEIPDVNIYKIYKNGIQIAETNEPYIEVLGQEGDKFSFEAFYNQEVSDSLYDTYVKDPVEWYELSWHPVPGAFSYRLYMDGATTPLSYIIEANSWTENSSYGIAEAYNFPKSTFKVKAFPWIESPVTSSIVSVPPLSICPSTCTDGIQNGSETGVDCGGSNCSACLSSVNNFTATTSSVCGGKVKLSWDAVTDADGYKIFRFIKQPDNVYLATLVETVPTNTLSLDIAVGDKNMPTPKFLIKAYSATLGESVGVSAMATASAACPDLSATCSVMPFMTSSFDTNGRIIFEASSSGGTPPYSYVWNSGTGQEVGSYLVSYVYSTAGTYYPTFTVIDSSTPSKSVITDCSTVVNSGEGVTIKNPVIDAECGSRAKQYSATSTGWGSFTGFCKSGSTIQQPPEPPSFPDLISSEKVTWFCKSNTGGSPSPTCTATRVSTSTIACEVSMINPNSNPELVGLNSNTTWKVSATNGTLPDGYTVNWYVDRSSADKFKTLIQPGNLTTDTWNHIFTTIGPKFVGAEVISDGTIIQCSNTNDYVPTIVQQGGAIQEQ